MKIKFNVKAKYKKIGLFAGVGLLFIILILIVTGKRKNVSKADLAPAVVIVQPEVKNLTESVTISGYVEANAMIPVVPFVSGTIMEYPAQAGVYVTKDTLLAKIDDEPFRQQMLQAQAAFSAAKSTFERVESLYKSGATTQQNYDNAKAQYDASKAQFDLANLQMNYTEVRAPVDGTVLIAGNAVGGVAAQGSPVAVLADLSDQVVRLKVPEKYFDLFTMERDNLSVTVTRPAEKKMYEDAVTTATIRNIAPYISPESKNFEVVCRLDDPGNRFRPGMYVKVQVAYKVHQNVPVVPLKAKKMDGSCYLYNPETETVQFIVPQKIAEDDESFIVENKYEKSWFVVDGQNFVFDGQQVRLYQEVLAEY